MKKLNGIELFTLLVFGCFPCFLSCQTKPVVLAEQEAKIVREKWYTPDSYGYGERHMIVAEDGSYIQLTSDSAFAKIKVGQEYSADWRE